MKRYLRLSFRAAALLALAVSTGMAQAPGTAPPDQVEEDWQLVVANPDPLGVGPQVTTCMSPNSDPAGAFLAFYVNYQDYPSWSPGGLQAKAYSAPVSPGGSPSLIDASSQGNGVCETQGETITWTQRLSLSGGSLQYVIANGQSRTWGAFGQGQGTLKVSMPSTLSDLGSYKPDYTVSKSGVSWQANRVTSMTLVQVRYYSNGQLVATDSTARPVTLGPGN
jgi:hypothetical protein